MLLSFFLLALGMALLIMGAVWLVDGGSALARRFNISNLTIGLTIVAFGTSAPEMVVNTFAAVDNYPGILFGNIFGSNTFNLFGILGLTGLIMPLTVQRRTVWKEIPLSLLAVLLAFVLANDMLTDKQPVLSRLDSLALLAVFGFFLFYLYKQLKADAKAGVLPEEGQANISTPKIWFLILIGLGGLFLGGQLAVNNAVNLAKILGVSDKIIGLTILAAGTSLAELVTCIIAVLRKRTDLAVGNIIGSNIFNLLLILPVSCLVRPMHYDRVFNTDLFLLAGGTALLFLTMFTGKRKRLDRLEAAVLLLIYLAYTGYLINREV